MEQAADFSTLSAAISAHMRPGMATNSTLKAGRLRREIQNGSLYTHRWPGGLLLLRRREGHCILNFYLLDRDAPLDIPLPGKTVVELPLRPGQGEGAADYWMKLGFRPILRRVRLARPPLEEAPVPLCPGSLSPRQVMDILTASHDPLTACLPSLAELAEDIPQGRVLTEGEGGALRFLPGRTAELRQLAVRPSHRGQGLSHRLVERFNSHTAGGRALVWTGADNHIAQQVYQAHRFTPDGWRSLVLLLDG